jgi:hypothetical protein
MLTSGRYENKSLTLSRILQIKPNRCKIFLSMFISFLYMFRVTICPSSGEITESMRHLVFVILRG